MSAAAEGFAFAAPGWLWLLPVLLLLAWLRSRRLERTLFAPAFLLPAGTAGPRLPRSWRARAFHLPSALHALMLALVVVAMARPQSRWPEPAPPAGRTIVLCLDQSSSMAATDLAPGRSRHDIGRAVAAAFVEARPHDRIGLVGFARYSDLRCPPTQDHAALRELLAALPMVAAESPEDATAIGAAVATAARSLERAAGGRVLIVVTDGEENVAHELAPDEIAPLHAAQLCAAAGIRVHAIQVGSGNIKPDGQVVPIDASALRDLAALTGGRHFAAADARALAEVYAQIDRLEAPPPAPPRQAEREWYPAVLGAALLLAALARGLALGWLGRAP